MSRVVERFCGLAKDTENDPGHLAPVAPILGRPERLRLNAFDLKAGVELQDRGVKVL